MNKFFRVALNQARKLISNPAKARKVMNKALKKSNRVKGDQGLVASLKENVILFFSMLADFFSGKYRGLPLKSGVKILAALLYFVFLIDLIPDFLAVIGIVDDAAVLAWVINSLGADIDDYKAWKNKDQPIETSQEEE